MASFVNPAPAELLAHSGPEIRFAEVLICRGNEGFELRHVADAEAPLERLEAVSVEGLGALAQTTVSGAFRPNKAAPTLRSGWRSTARDANELGSALETLYPGALADWLAVRRGAATATSFRDFARRQTGRYRITQTLTDAQAAVVICAGCHRRFCLRQRLWTVGGLETDAAGAKSVIPCLEPCALLLEFARCTAGRERENKVALELAVGEAATLAAALDLALACPDPTVREGDVAHPANPRQLQLLRQKLAIHPRAENSPKQD